MSSFVEHPFFAEVLPYMYAQPTGAYDNARIQLRRRKMPFTVKAKLAEVTMPCVSCGDVMHPLRNGRYFAATCPIDRNICCSRTSKASIEYSKVRLAISFA